MPASCCCSRSTARCSPSSCASARPAGASHGGWSCAGPRRSGGLSIPAGTKTAPLQIRACGQQWIWRYEYPDGTYSYYELVVPVDTAVVLKLCSTDVVHRWYVPGLSGKFDATPGETNQAWFKADETGDFDGASYAFSGASYAVMRTRVHVVDVPTYQAWLEQQAAGIQEAQNFVQQVNGETGG